MTIPYLWLLVIALVTVIFIAVLAVVLSTTNQTDVNVIHSEVVSGNGIVTFIPHRKLTDQDEPSTRSLVSPSKSVFSITPGFTLSDGGIMFTCQTSLSNAKPMTTQFEFLIDVVSVIEKTTSSQDGENLIDSFTFMRNTDPIGSDDLYVVVNAKHIYNIVENGDILYKNFYMDTTSDWSMSTGQSSGNSVKAYANLYHDTTLINQQPIEANVIVMPYSHYITTRQASTTIMYPTMEPPLPSYPTIILKDLAKQIKLTTQSNNTQPVNKLVITLSEDIRIVTSTYLSPINEQDLQDISVPPNDDFIIPPTDPIDGFIEFKPATVTGSDIEITITEQSQTSGTKIQSSSVSIPSNVAMLECVLDSSVVETWENLTGPVDITYSLNLSEMLSETSIILDENTYLSVDPTYTGDYTILQNDKETEISVDGLQIVSSFTAVNPILSSRGLDLNNLSLLQQIFTNREITDDFILNITVVGMTQGDIYKIYNQLTPSSPRSFIFVPGLFAITRSIIASRLTVNMTNNIEVCGSTF
jgi:hypothetical protein